MDLMQKYVRQVIEKSTPFAPLWNIEAQSKKEPHWNYIDGCVMTAIMDLYKYTGDKVYFDFVKEFIDAYCDENGNLLGYHVDEYNVDHINEGRVLFDLYEITGEEKYKKAIELLYSQLQGQPRIAQGNFWHKKIYPNQVWLDGTYMAQPFYTLYETKFNKLANYRDIFIQLTNVRKYMYNEDKKLYHHGWDASGQMFWANKDGVSQNFWLRAIGWYTVALVDILDIMDEQMLYEFRTLRRQFIELIDGMLKYQDEKTGMWYQLVDKADIEGNYLETSGTAMVAYAILKGVRIGVLPERYLQYGLKAYDGTIETQVTFENDSINVESICLVAGLGPDDNRRRDGSVEYYLSEPIVKNEGKGIAPLILAYAEVARLNR